MGPGEYGWGKNTITNNNTNTNIIIGYVLSLIIIPLF